MLDVQTLRAGDSLTYTRTLPDYPANAGWQLRLHLAGPSVLTKLATASGADHVVTLTPTDTTALLPGIHQWIERVTKGAEIYTVNAGEISVLENLATATAGQLTDVDQALLTDVEAELRARTAEGGMVEQYTIANRSVTRMSTADLYALRGKLRAQISRRKYGSSYLEAQALVTFSGRDRL